jgi:hypothetical protein
MDLWGRNYNKRPWFACFSAIPGQPQFPFSASLKNYCFETQVAIVSS